MFNSGEFVVTNKGFVGSVVGPDPYRYGYSQVKFSSNTFSFKNTLLTRVRYSPGDKVCISGREGTFTIRRVSDKFAYIDKSETRTPFHWPIPYNLLRVPGNQDHYMDIFKE